MPKIRYLLIFSFMLSLGAKADMSDDFTMGVSLIGSTTGSSESYDIEGVLLFNYDGYGVELDMDKDLRLIPTDVKISVDGKMVQVYTNVATLDYYMSDDIEIAATLIAIDYRKFNDYSIRKSEKAAAASFAITKYLAVGSFAVDLGAHISLGGYTRDQILLEDGKHLLKDTHYYTIGAKIGIDIPITDEYKLYIYARADYQQGDETSRSSYAVGAELYEGIDMFNETIHVVPYVDYVSERIDYGSSSVQDNMFRFGIRFTF